MSRVLRVVLVAVIVGPALTCFGCRTPPYEAPLPPTCLSPFELDETESLPTGAGIPAMALGDWNHDGRTDVFLIRPDLRAWLGSASGQLVPQEPVPPGQYYAPYAGDFDGDGVLDVVLSFSPTEQPLQGVVARGLGDGRFGALVPFDNNLYVGHPLDVGDVNGDGRSDLLISDRVQVRTLLASPDGQLTAAKADAPPLVTRLVADFDGDGKEDVAGPDENEEVSLGFGAGDGTFPRTAVFTTPHPIAALIITVLARADLDGNGHPDVLAIGDDRAVDAWLTSKGGVLTPGVGLPAGSIAVSQDPEAPGFLASGDWNGDGRADLAVATLSADSAVGLACGHGDGSFDDPVALVDTTPGSPHEGHRVAALGAGDVDGDGRSDLIVLWLTGSDDNPSGSLSVYLTRRRQ